MTIEEETGIIYGLDYQARTLCGIVGEPEKVQFLIGTQSLKLENQICLLNLDEDTNQVTKTSYAHECGEVWHLSSCPEKKELVSTCYTSVADNQTKSGCSVWALTDEPIAESNNYKLTKVSELDNQSATSSLVSCFQWQPGNSEKALVLHGPTASVISSTFNGKTFRVEGTVEIESKTQSRLPIAKWNPHHNSNTFATTSDSSVKAWDIRTMQTAFKIDQAHMPLVRDVDFNPNKQYYLATAGDDCKVKFWDTRNTEKPLLTSAKHSHWVWCVRYNPIHDQLVLSCSSDSRVCLQSFASLSSEPAGQVDDGSDTEFGRLEDGVIGVSEEHEESVYCCDWSTSDPWIYASLSYDGRVIINKVPRTVKYKILQL